jgi:hypothetical protein
MRAHLGGPLAVMRELSERLDRVALALYAFNSLINLGSASSMAASTYAARSLVADSALWRTLATLARRCRISFSTSSGTSSVAW